MISVGLPYSSPQRTSSPSGPVIYQPDASSASPRSTALLNSARTRTAPPPGFQRASQSYPMNEEDMFDQMGDDMDWDAISSQSQPAPLRHFQYAQPQQYQQRQIAPAPRTAGPDMIALQRALQAERQRANMAESMLSRVHRQPLNPDFGTSSQSGDPMLSSPSAPHRPGVQLQQQRRILADATNTSFDFDPQFRQQPQQGVAENERNHRTSTPDKQNKKTGASTWGLPSDDPLKTLRKSAYVSPMTASSNIPIVPKSAMRKFCLHFCILISVSRFISSFCFLAPLVMFWTLLDDSSAGLSTL